MESMKNPKDRKLQKKRKPWIDRKIINRLK